MEIVSVIERANNMVEVEIDYTGVVNVSYAALVCNVLEKMGYVIPREKLGGVYCTVSSLTEPPTNRVFTFHYMPSTLFDKAIGRGQ